MNLVINKCVTAVKVSNFSGHYLRNRSTLDMGVLGYIGIVQHKEHSPEVLSIPPGTLCISSWTQLCLIHFLCHLTEFNKSLTNECIRRFCEIILAGKIFMDPTALVGLRLIIAEVSGSH